MTDEAKALALAADKPQLLARLKSARLVLTPDFRKRFGVGRFDFDNKRLVGNGFILQWRVRPYPKQRIGYENQQTSIGVINLELA